MGSISNALVNMSSKTLAIKILEDNIDNLRKEMENVSPWRINGSKGPNGEIITFYMIGLQHCLDYLDDDEYLNYCSKRPYRFENPKEYLGDLCEAIVITFPKPQGEYASISVKMRCNEERATEFMQRYQKND